MSTSDTATPSEGKSLADRITKPDSEETDAVVVVAKDDSVEKDAETTAETSTEKVEQNAEESAKEESLEQAQLDGPSDTVHHGPGLDEPEYDVDVKLSELQELNDPSNPLFSAKSFEELNLDSAILKGLYRMNFRRPSKIQEKALPLLLRDPPMNLIGQSQSGTGKTAAFVLNILSRLDLSEGLVNKPQALCLAPSRELARQIMGVIQVMGGFVNGLKTEAAIPAGMGHRRERVEANVVVGTPGTTMDMIKRRLLDPSHIKILVLDEADNMLDQQGLGDQCIRVKAFLPKNIQIVLFSATFPEFVFKYAIKFAPDANQITLKHEELTVEGIRQLYLDCPNIDDKYSLLVKLYGLLTIGSSIIFVKRRDTAAEIERRMTEEGHKVACLTGGYEGAQRDEVIDSFRDGHTKVLITTNVLSRGIDVSTVSMVINYDIPELPNGSPDYQTYLHRIGRTGRFGRVGVSISFVHDKRSWLNLKAISEYFGVAMTRLQTDDWDSVEDTVKKVIRSSRASANFTSRKA